MSAPAKMTPEQFADLVLRKKKLDDELKAVRALVKLHADDVDVPFAFQRGDNIVTVKKPQYSGGMPQCDVIPLLGLGACSS